MKQTLILLLSMLTLGTPAIHAADDEQPVIELRADRTFIYPQRMNLTGEESLLDILLMFPDQMQTGFDKMIDAYNLRIDNAPLNGNTRLLCSQIKAKTISKVQICDNTAVAKGTIGMGRVIDVNLLRMEKGAHGFVSAQYATDNQLTPSAQVMVGTEKTDIYVNASYNYQDKFQKRNNDQYFSFHMTNWFSKHDRLLTYVTQQYKDDRTYSNDVTKSRSEKLMARARYFHNFNDIGTELLIVGGYTYSNSPTLKYSTDTETGTKNSSILGIVELNTPLFTKNLDMMLGWEGDWDYYTYNTCTPTVCNGYKFMDSNNDIYLQFNYKPGTKWRLTLGDRVMFFHYNPSDKSINETRNNWQASAIFMPTKKHQIQAGYFRKFFKPSYGYGTIINSPTLEDLENKLIASNIDEWKLAYTYTTANLSVNLASSYFGRHAVDGWTPSGTYSFLSDMWKNSVSIYWKTGILTLNAGANYYYQKDDDNYAAFNIAPTLSLPYSIQVSPKVTFFTNDITSSTKMVAMQYADYSKTYAELQVHKQFGKHWNGMVQWHDIFSSRYSACLFGVQYRF